MQSQEKWRLRDLGENLDGKYRFSATRTNRDELERRLNRLEKRGLGTHRRAKYIKYQLKNKAKK